MSECVVRMEMPSKDRMCQIADDIDGIWYCSVMKKLCRKPDNGEMPSWCPIICSITEGNGRLVDADKLKKWLIDQIDYYKRFDGPNCSIMVSAYEAVCRVIDDFQTIVPAERSET